MPSLHAQRLVSFRVSSHLECHRRATSLRSVHRHKFFNTNNLWVNLDKLAATIEANGGLLKLPLIKNKKTVNPRDSESTPVRAASCVPQQLFFVVSTTFSHMPLDGMWLSRITVMAADASSRKLQFNELRRTSTSLRPHATTLGASPYVCIWHQGDGHLTGVVCCGAQVFQLETAMGSAIESFDDASAVVVPRSRFAPVKTTNDLFVLRSDAYLVRHAALTAA